MVVGVSINLVTICTPPQLCLCFLGAQRVHWYVVRLVNVARAMDITADAMLFPHHDSMQHLFDLTLQRLLYRAVCTLYYPHSKYKYEINTEKTHITEVIED